MRGWERGDRVSVKSLRMVNLTGLGNRLHVGGEEEIPDPGSMMGCTTNLYAEYKWQSRFGESRRIRLSTHTAD